MNWPRSWAGFFETRHAVKTSRGRYTPLVKAKACADYGERRHRLGDLGLGLGLINIGSRPGGVRETQAVELTRRDSVKIKNQQQFEQGHGNQHRQHIVHSIEHGSNLPRTLLPHRSEVALTRSSAYPSRVFGYLWSVISPPKPTQSECRHAKLQWSPPRQAKASSPASDRIARHKTLQSDRLHDETRNAKEGVRLRRTLPMPARSKT